MALVFSRIDKKRKWSEWKHNREVNEMKALTCYLCGYHTILGDVWSRRVQRSRVGNIECHFIVHLKHIKFTQVWKHDIGLAHGKWHCLRLLLLVKAKNVLLMSIMNWKPKFRLPKTALNNLAKGQVSQKKVLGLSSVGEVHRSFNWTIINLHQSILS